MTVIVENLRAFAADAQGAADMISENMPTIVKVAMRQNARMFNAAADHIEAEEKRFAEHLEAWKKNNEWHAARIAELERENRILRDYCRDPGEAKAAIHAATGL